MRMIGKRLGVVMVLAVATLMVLAGCEVSVWIGNLPDEPEPDPNITFTLEWEGDENLDLYMTYPDVVDTTPTDAPTFESPYNVDPSNFPGDVPFGFAPEDLTAKDWAEDDNLRAAVYWDQLASGRQINGEAAVQLTNEASNGEEDEVITLRGFPFEGSATNVSANGGGATGLPTGYDYTWVGVMELYVYADGSSKISYADPETPDTQARVLIHDAGELIGTYELPRDIDLQGASVIRINCFWRNDGSSEVEYYQFVPEVALVTTTDLIRGAGQADTDIITMSGNAR